ncbi:MAG: hypothetical protein KF882_02030 [Bacteroidia bacterium]|nr:hypothetical protein [Bacteroidia bacterium]MCO5254025.1 hypothetical protein [Bacteroidota bacterium]
MKQKILLFLLPLAITTNCFSQGNEKNSKDCVRKGFTSINMGVSIPTGNFKSDNFNNNEAGFATNGAVFDIAYGYEIAPDFGVTVVYRGQANGKNLGTYAQSLANFFGSGSVSVESSAFTLGGVMAGIYGSHPITNKLSIQARTLAGFSVAVLPAMTTIAYDDSKTKLVTWFQDRAETTTFSYIIGAGATLDISKKTYLLFNLDFYSANAEWDDVRIISIGHITKTTEIDQYNFKQKFSTVNMSIGLGFRI